MIFAALAGACTTQNPATPQVPREKVTVVLECKGFGLSDFHEHKTKENLDIVRDSYDFRIIEPEFYAGKDIQLYLPQRINGFVRGINDQERVRVDLDKRELDRLFTRAGLNIGPPPSDLIQDAVTVALIDLLNKRANQRPERNAGAASSSTSTSTPVVAHP